MPYRAGYHSKYKHRTRARRHAAGVIGRAWRKRRKPSNKRWTNKKLTVRVKRLLKMNAIKHHYVMSGPDLTNLGAPVVLSLTGIGAGESSETHEGNSIVLRSLSVRCRVSVENTGTSANINKPTRYNLMLVSSVLDTGLADVPTYASLFDTSTAPSSFLVSDCFRQLNSESLGKVKILKSVSGTLQPQQGIIETVNPWVPGAASYPSFKYITFTIDMSRARINYRENTSIALNRNYYLMYTSNAVGTGNNLGITFNVASKLTFRDIE